MIVPHATADVPLVWRAPASTVSATAAALRFSDA